MNKPLTIFLKLFPPFMRKFPHLVIGWVIAVFILIFVGSFPTGIISPLGRLKPLHEKPSLREVFGFAPHWTINKLDNVDFKTLTTLAYFGIPVKGDGNLNKSDVGYTTFRSDQASEIFKRAHAQSTKVVLTITQMDNTSIKQLMDSEEAQRLAIAQTVEEVENRGIDGVNVDFEYVGDPGQGYRNKFTKFVTDLNSELEKQNPDSYLTVSVYAGSLIEPKIYNIKELGAISDGIFMMAYDYAAYKATSVIPTAPLYGYKEGKYWYDVATAVEDFSKVMDSKKIILGVPWYGYDYQVYEPGEKTATQKGYSYRYKTTYKKKGKTYTAWKKGYFQPQVNVQTYKNSQAKLGSNALNITEYQEGWDDVGKVGWKAYKTKGNNTWRMTFVEDTRSLGHKYDLAQEKNLGGIGIWALGFDDGRAELWDQLAVKFGDKTENLALVRRVIANQYE